MKMCFVSLQRVFGKKDINYLNNLIMKKFYLILSLILFSFIANAAISGPSHTICPNTACWYYSEYTGSEYTYEWTVTGGSIEHGLTTSSVCIYWYDTNGTHKVSVTVRDGDINLGTQSKTVKVFSLKDLLPANFTKGDFIVRPGDNTPVTYEIPAIYFPQYSGDKQYINEYQWVIPNGWKYYNNVSDGTPFTTDDSSITVTPDDCNGGTIKVRGVSGCSDMSKSDYREKEINRAGNPISSSTSNAVCGESQEITLQIESIPGTTYQWTKPTSWTWTSGTNSNVVKVMPDGLSGGAISVIVDGCTSLKESKTITLYNWDPSDPDPTITGSNLICSSGSTFSVDALPSGYTVTWTSSSNITFPSGNTGGTITAKTYSSISSGSGWIEATINGACGDVTLPRKNVWVGVPDNLIGEIWNKEDGEDQTFCKTNYFSAENSVTIRCDGASFNAQYEWDILTDNFGYNTRNNKIDIQPYTEGFIAFRVKVENSCGWSDWASFSYPVIDCDGSGGEMFMMASPNPANEYAELNFYSENELSNYQKETMVSIPVNEESQDLGEYEIQIWHERKGLVKQLKSKSKKLQIPTNNLEEGIYFLHIIVNGKVYKQQLKVQR